MSNLKRFFAPGQCCFITTVTAKRRPILTERPDFIYHAIRVARTRYSFDPIAWAILPSHFHLLLDCPGDDTSKIVRTIKQSFSMRWRKFLGISGPVWQHRYWDHVIRDEEDFKRHFDYIHFNPVKHNQVRSPRDWSLSSFRLYVRKGVYSLEWGESENIGEGDFGE
jgi:putative transposase